MSLHQKIDNLDENQNSYLNEEEEDIINEGMIFKL